MHVTGFSSISFTLDATVTCIVTNSNFKFNRKFQPETSKRGAKRLFTDQNVQQNGISMFWLKQA